MLQLPGRGEAVAGVTGRSRLARVLDRVRDSDVLGVDRRAERGQSRDRRDGNESGDESVLDRGGASAVLHKLADELDHDILLVELNTLQSARVP